MTPPRLARGRQYLAALMIGAALSGGCTTFQPEPPAPPIDASRPLSLTGRFSISYTESLPEPKTEHHSGRFLLKKDAQDLGIELFSPFGQTIVRAGQHQGEPAWLDTARHQRFTGQSLEDVLQQAIGIPVPADRLPDWLSDRFETVLERSGDGSRIRARDRGWQIERTNRRWHLLWHQNTRRLEIRLVVDPSTPDTSTPLTETGSATLAPTRSAPNTDAAASAGPTAPPADTPTAPTPAAPAGQHALSGFER